MAITSVELSETGRTGKWSLSSRTYVSTYIVTTDDKDDGPASVLESGVGGLPRVGDTYTDGAGVTDWEAVLKTKSAKPKGSARLMWLITCNFETPGSGDKEEKPDSDGKETDNPLEWRDEVSISPVPRSVPVEKATNRTNLTAISRPSGKEGPVTNSAGQPLNPPLEMDRSLTLIRISKRLLIFPADKEQQYQDSTNSDQFTIDKFGYVRTMEPYEAKLAISGALTTTNGVQHWKVDFELTLDSYLSWRPVTYDRGTMALAVEGGPSGFANALLGSDFRDGTPALRAILDVNNQPIDEPVLFNGVGQPLPQGETEPFLIEWSVRTEQPFADLEF